MRLVVHLSPNTSPVNFNYLNETARFFYGHVGIEGLHGNVSLYSLSFLRNGTPSPEGGLDFPNGSSFFVSAHDNQIIENLKNNIQTNEHLLNGMKVFATKVYPDIVPETESVRMVLRSPCLLRDEDGFPIMWYMQEAQERLEEIAKRKMKLANIPLSELESIRPDLRSPIKFKSISYEHDGNTIYNKCSLGSAVVKGTPKALTFLWNVGLGESTGIGFGSVDIQTRKRNNND
jgi:CRISPR-associated endoribonuclease Cas6